MAAAAAQSLQSCLTLCDPIDGRPPGSPVPGILQARTLEWVAVANGSGFQKRLNQIWEQSEADIAGSISFFLVGTAHSHDIHSFSQPLWQLEDRHVTCARPVGLRHREAT